MTATIRLAVPGDQQTLAELTSWSFNRGAHAALRRLGFRPKVVRFARESTATGNAVY